MFGSGIEGDSLRAWSVEMNSAEYIYGSGSEVVAQIESTQNLPLFDYIQGIATWEFSVVLLLLLGLYCYQLFRYGVIIKHCFRSLFSVGGALELFENQPLEFTHFFKFSRYLSLFSLAVGLSVLYYDIEWQGVGFNLFYFILVLCGALLVGSLLKIALRRLISLYDPISGRWVNLSRIITYNNAMCSVIFTPIVILLSSSVPFEPLLFWAIVVLVVYHFIRIKLLFNLQGFSFLQSILYLCAVEIAPFVFLWGVVSRFFLS